MTETALLPDAPIFVALSDFIKDAGKHAGQVKSTGRAEILTEAGEPELAVVPVDEYQDLLREREYNETVKAIQRGLDDIETGRCRPLSEFVAEWTAETASRKS